MFEIYYFVKGLFIGFIVAAPAGPVSIFCIRRTLSKGRFQGFATGLGATVGDGIYATIAAFGLTFVINFLMREEFLLRFLGGFFLAGMGIYIICKKRKLKHFKEPDKDGGHLREAFGTALLLDLSNPITIFAYIAIFSGFGLANAQQHVFSAISLVVGVITGAALWWFLLTQLIVLFRKKMNANSIIIISRISGILLIFFGLFVLYTTIFQIKFFGESF